MVYFTNIGVKEVLPVSPGEAEVDDSFSRGRITLNSDRDIEEPNPARPEERRNTLSSVRARPPTVRSQLRTIDEDPIPESAPDGKPNRPNGMLKSRLGLPLSFTYRNPVEDVQVAAVKPVDKPSPVVNTFADSKENKQYDIRKGATGRGLFAQHSISKGTLITTEHSVMRIFGHDSARKASKGSSVQNDITTSHREVLLHDFRFLASTQPNVAEFLGTLLPQTGFAEDDGPWIEQVWEAFSFEGYPETETLKPMSNTDLAWLFRVVGTNRCLFRHISFLNHSCKWNARLEQSHEDEATIARLYADRDIQAGEEITVHYGCLPGWTDEASLEEIQRRWGFSCVCTYCLSDRVDEKNAGEISRLFKWWSSIKQ